MKNWTLRCGVAILILSMCGSSFVCVCNGQSTTRQSLAETYTPLLITSENDIRYGDFGMLMECPAHLHGTPVEAMTKLEGLLANRTFPTSQPSTIYVCRVDQKLTLTRFAPLVDRIVVNPFVALIEARPAMFPCWSNVQHPLVDNACMLRSLVPGKQLIACIATNGEEELFGERSPSLEEIRWQILTICGANYQGIAFRRGAGDDETAKKIETLCAMLAQHAGDLSSARPVSWVNTDVAIPISSLRTRDKLFVPLLNPAYMNTRGGSGQAKFQVPLDDIRQRGTLRLTPPAGLKVVSARTLWGQAANLQVRPNQTTCDFSFVGGGDMLVFDLVGESNEDMKESLPAIRFVPKRPDSKAASASPKF